MHQYKKFVFWRGEPWTPLGELTTLSRPRGWLGRSYTPPYSPAPRRLLRSHWVRRKRAPTTWGIEVSVRLATARVLLPGVVSSTATETSVYNQHSDQLSLPSLRGR